jgi:hypothetical protein
MLSYNIELSKRTKELAEFIPLEESYLKSIVKNILNKADELKLDLSGNIMVGLDVNGPIVSTDDNDLIPFKGATECIKYMMNIPGIEVSLMTGWDLSTMDFFRKNKLNMPEIGIVGEYGMVYERKGNFRYLYPYREDERLSFMCQILKLASEMELKVAFQGNYSPGSGAICVEADEHGNLLNHPLVKGRRPTIKQIFNSAKEKSKIELIEKEEKIIFENKPDNLKGIAETLFKVHPLISVRVKKEAGKKISIKIDPKDKPDFNFEKVKEFAKIAEKETGRSSIAYEDHGVDLISKEAEKGNYSKDSGLREFGREAFGNKPFMVSIIGDKKSDIPKTLGDVLFFPLKGSDAEPIAKERNVPSVSLIDVRDFSLALVEAHRIKSL